LPPLVVRRGGHPVPASDAAEVGREVLALARALGPSDVALCLVSGGGSAMLELPREGLSIDDVVRETRRLLASGADIREINRARAEMSQLKGGRLAAAIAPARIVNVVISDVPDADPAVVASGPTVPAPESGIKATTVIAADNAAARAAVVAEGARAGMRIEDLGEILRGEAADAGRSLIEIARTRIDAGADGIVAGGETTVTLGESAGKGGRNHELALGAWGAIARGARLTIAAFGTDGIDGTSDAAGALVDEDAITRSRTLELDPQAALIAHDTAVFFAALGTQLRPGPTATNVADLAIVLR
jgi:hydroxypyruvate reductase